MTASDEDLFGTDERPPQRRLLTAGPISVILEDGNLRDIRFGGVEMIRAVNYLARDASWGTLPAELTDIDIAETETSFEVAFTGLCGSPKNLFRYRMRIRGDSAGRLEMEAVGEALTDFVTNRTGFVVLHPAEAAGGALRVRHSGGDWEETEFPRLISADQPAFDITALAHEPAPGLVCTIEMEGDAFEMEDQRNWADASFKTYIRPLSKPRPYVIVKGAKDRQRIVLRIAGKAPASSPGAVGPAVMTLGAQAGRMPAMALFLDDILTPMDTTFAAGLAQQLIVRLDPANDADGAGLKRAASLAAGGASVAVELILDARDADAEAEAVFLALVKAGVTPSALLVSPRRDLKSRPSRSIPDGEQPIGALVATLRRAGFACPIGTGTPSYFTEFNRNPPVADCDFVFFSTAAIVHAADDISVMETLHVYPHLVKSARALCPGSDIWLGPCTIGVRHNPYGSDVQPNPDGKRVASARFDPRHGALFGAAFAAGVAGQAAACQVTTLTLAAPVGPFGLADEHARNRPIHAVQAELAAAAGAPRCDLSFSRPGIGGVAYRSDRGLRALVANLSPDEISLDLPDEFGSALLVEADAGLSRLPVERGRIVMQAYRTAVLSA